MMNIIHELGSLVKSKKIPNEPNESISSWGYGTIIEVGETPYHGIIGFDDIGIPSDHESKTVPIYNVAWSDTIMRWHLPWELETVSNGR